MTQSSGPVRLSLRATAHRPFVLGHPGIPQGDHREPATVQGTVEVRVVAQPVKAKWVRVEVRKYEVLKDRPAPAKGTPAYTHVGKVHLLWKAGEGKEYEVVPTRDFRFIIPLPLEDLPSTLDNPKVDIKYELVASICYKQKGGLFRKSSPTQSQTSEPLHIVRYDLTSAWPKYQASSQQIGYSSDGEVSLIVERPQQAFGPGDSVFVMTMLKSASPQSFTFQALDVSLVEMFTSIPPEDPKATKKSKKPVAQQPTTKTEVVTSKRFTINQTMRFGEEKAFKGSIVVPSDPTLLTIRGAKTLSIEYKVVVQALCDSGTIVVEQPCEIGAFGKQSASQVVREIGYVPGLSESQRGHVALNSLSGQMFKSSTHLGSETSSTTTSMSSKPPNGPQSSTPFGTGGSVNSPSGGLTAGRLGVANTMQGYFPRRSSSTTTSTTTTSDFGPNPSVDRHFTTMPPTSRSNTASPPTAETLRDRQTTLTHSKSNKWRPLDGAISEASSTGHTRNATSGSAPAPSVPVGAPPGYVHAGASGAGASGAGVSGVNGHGANGSAAQAPQFASAAQEKDIQRQRYEEAQNRVGGSSGGGSSYVAPAAAVAGVAGAGLAATGVAAAPGQYPTAAQEKDRLRYAAAVANRDAAQGSAPPPGPDEAPISYEELFGSGAGSSTAGPSAAGSSSAAAGPSAGPSAAGSSSAIPPGAHPAAVPGVPAAYMSAAEEKEAMRRRYEDATTRVTRATGVPLATSPSPPPSNVGSGSAQQPQPQSPAQPYLSAAEEKELMRKRYEEATNKVARATASDRAQSPEAQQQQSSVPAAYMSAAEEKEMMRRRYEEATNRVASATGSPAAAVAGGSGPRAGTVSPTPAGSAGSVPAAYLSAAEEKELMRKRYEEATNRVASATGSPIAGGSGARAGTVSPTPASSVPAAYMTAAEEKEMMRRRYEEATNRVASATGSPAAGGSARDGTVSPTPASSVPAAYMSAAEEKEMMRRRYEEATKRVASTTGVPVGAVGASDIASGSNGAAHPVSPTTSPGAPGQASGTSGAPAAYLSAAEEKELMRRRYEEATSRVARATSPSGAVPSDAPPAFEDVVGTPPLAHASASGSTVAAPPSAAAGPVAGQSSAPAAYMTAAEEKEAMRRRYEEATGRVARATGSVSPPPTGGLPGSGSIGAGLSSMSGSGSIPGQLSGFTGSAFNSASGPSFHPSGGSGGAGSGGVSGGGVSGIGAGQRIDSPEPVPGVSTLPPQLPPISLGDAPTSPLATINGRYSFLGAASQPLEGAPAKARPLTHLPPPGPAPPVPTRPPQDYIDNLV